MVERICPVVDQRREAKAALAAAVEEVTGTCPAGSSLSDLQGAVHRAVLAWFDRVHLTPTRPAYPDES